MSDRRPVAPRNAHRASCGLPRTALTLRCRRRHRRSALARSRYLGDRPAAVRASRVAADTGSGLALPCTRVPQGSRTSGKIYAWVLEPWLHAHMHDTGLAVAQVRPRREWTVAQLLCVQEPCPIIPRRDGYVGQEDTSPDRAYALALRETRPTAWYIAMWRCRGASRPSSVSPQLERSGSFHTWTLPACMGMPTICACASSTAAPYKCHGKPWSMKPVCADRRPDCAPGLAIGCGSRKALEPGPKRARDRENKA